MTTRTTEQVTADDALAGAVADAMRAYGYAEAGGLTAGFIVLVDQRVWRSGDDEDAGMSSVCMLYKDGDMPWVQILGLLRFATLIQEHNAMQPADGD